MKNRYLYGASVQGIQSFIFETNKLKEIVGASEMIEQICTEKYKDFIEADKIEVILAAAGNIRLIAEDTDELKEIVRRFPKEASDCAPGITISQAVVELIENKEKDSMNTLEDRLKIQRNKPPRPTQITALGIERSRRTGKSAIERDKDGCLIDKASYLKRKNLTGKDLDAHSHLASKLIGLPNVAFKKIKDRKIHFPLNMDDITNKQCGWLAVIHADGNNLGKLIQELSGDDILKSYKDFSTNLDSATCKAAANSFDKSLFKKIEEGKIEITNYKFPIRPIVIGGDDLTVICRADLAIDFITTYLKEFESETSKIFKDIFKENKQLTACAGIAFVKKSYPFHYAIKLAEELCAVAKLKSKSIDPTKLKLKSIDPANVPSSLIFHKIQSSYVDTYGEIKERELTAAASGIKFDYGPYAIDDNVPDMPYIENLIKRVKILKEKESPKTGLRKWLFDLHKDEGNATQLMNRIKKITKEHFVKDLGLDKAIIDNKTMIYDMLTLLSIEGGEV